MSIHSPNISKEITSKEWFRSLSQYEKPDLKKATWQLINTFVPYFALWGVMLWMVRQGFSAWYFAPLIVVAAGLSVRIFIFFHDCGHGSFFANHRANRILGAICGVLIFTPYEAWRKSHATHHTTAEDLDRRGVGDVLTWTVEEYQKASKLRQLGYRIFRNPLFLFVLAPPVLFLLVQRFTNKNMNAAERRSTWENNIHLSLLFVVMHFTIGLPTYLSIQIPIMLVASGVGVWLFYVQHQFEGVYWARHEDWDPIRAALEGSSYYKLPKVLQWFSGNIGLHHIHHLRSRIPNYHLQACYDNTPELHVEKPLTLWDSLKTPFLNLWDEQSKNLISFRTLKKLSSS
jgi:omega-6 fatty acid desaturase (delta-12 desaturase)